MEKSELLLLLKTFTGHDFKKLGNFVKSPYFNSLRSIVKLYEALKNFYPEFAGRGFTRENIFKMVFPGAGFDDARLRVLFSRMLALVQNFLSYETYSVDSFGMAFDAGIEIFSKGRMNLFKKSISAAEKALEDLEYKDAEYYNGLYRLTLLKNSSKGYYGLTGEDLKKEEDLIFIYSIVSLLKTYSTAMNAGMVLDMQITAGRIEKLIPFINEYLGNPLIKIYYNIYLLLKNPSEEKYFFEHIRITAKHVNVLNREESFDLYIILLNNCVHKIMEGRKEFVKHKFDLYKLMLAEGYFTGEGRQFPYTFFNNIVNSAIEGGEYKWGKKFIKEYKHMLPEQMKENIICLCEAKMHYAQKDYEKALEYLAGIRNSETDDVFYKLAIRDLQIKIFFDMKHYENIYPSIDSYLHFLKNNRQLNARSKNNYRTYLKNLKRFLDILSGSGKLKMGDFRHQLKISPDFIYKSWMLEKAEKYENRRKD